MVTELLRVIGNLLFGKNAMKSLLDDWLGIVWVCGSLRESIYIYMFFVLGFYRNHLGFSSSAFTFCFFLFLLLLFFPLIVHIGSFCKGQINYAIYVSYFDNLWHVCNVSEGDKFAIRLYCEPIWIERISFIWLNLEFIFLPESIIYFYCDGLRLI